MQRQRLVLGAILLLAAALRFAGLPWGLRHRAIEAERDFVHSVWEMVAARDLDQRFYEYPGLFFHLLYLPVAAVQAAGLPESRAYLAARGLVAAFGVLSVAATYALGSRLAGARAGVVAALLLAVSPLEVETAHRVRPDVVLESFSLVALLMFRRLGPEWRGDLRSAVALGLATAVKPTGALLAPSYIAARLLAPGPRLSRVALVGAFSILLVVLLTPYALIAPGKFAAGVRAQVSYHYAHAEWSDRNPTRPDSPTRPAGSGVVSRPALALFYLKNVATLLGPVAAALAAAGLVMVLGEWRAWAPLLLFPLTTLGVVSSAEMGHARFLVPLGGVLAILAARALAGLAQRWKRAFWPLALAAALPPLVASAAYARGITRPTPLDQALDWIEARLPEGARILSTSPHLGLERERYNLAWPGRRPVRENRLVALHMDLVVADPEDPIVEGFEEVFRAGGAIPQAGPTLGLFVAPAALRPAYRPIPLAQARLSASESPELLPSLVDNDRSTFWRTSLPRRGAWIQMDLRSPARLGRVDLTLKRAIPSDLRVLVTEDATWREVVAAEFQTTVRGPVELSLFLEPTRALGLRLEPVRKVPIQWTIAELALGEVVTP